MLDSIGGCMAELIDVLDENGIKTGRIVTRDEVHREGLWHRAIIVGILNSNNQILLQQRAVNKEKNASLWDISVAGHVSSGQDSLMAAMREINEEAGLNVGYHTEIKDFRYVFGFREEREYSSDFIERQFYDLFLLYLPDLSIDDVKIQLEEVQAVRLCNLIEFQQMIDDGIMVDRQPVYDELFKYMEHAE